jgi:hypothetical protein
LVFVGFCFSILLILLVISFSFYVLMTYPESWVKTCFHCWEADEASRVTMVQQDSIHTHKPPPFTSFGWLNFCASFVESPVSWITTFKLWLSRFSCITLVPLREPVYSVGDGRDCILLIFVCYVFVESPLSCITWLIRHLRFSCVSCLWDAFSLSSF